MVAKGKGKAGVVRKVVTCSICKGRYMGTVPKGGDGSVLFPAKHLLCKAEAEALGLPDRVCPGTFRYAKEYQDKGG